MRPWMAAPVLLIACLLVTARPAAAQQEQPRRFPELLELMQSDAPAKNVEPASTVDPAFAMPVNSPPSSAKSRVRDAQVAPAVNFSSVSEGSFVKPVSGSSEAWPSNGPRPALITEPVAAPPATPLEAPPELPIPAPRTVTFSPMHTLQVHPQIPEEPPLLPEYQAPRQTVEMTSGGDQFIAPPASSIDPQMVMTAEGLSPIPESPPQPDPFMAGPVMNGGWQPNSTAMLEDPSGLYGSGEYMGMEGGMDQAYFGGRSTYRNLAYPECCLPTDPCAEFLPFGNLGVKLGTDRVIAGGGFFIPLWQNCDSLIFTELRGNADDRNSGDGFIGLGYRTFLDPQWMMGTYIYGDLIVTNQNNVFGQGQLGFELMSLDWDIRVNGYAPGQATQSANRASGISNGTAITRNFRERAYPGFDFEVGRRILNWGLNDQYEVRWFMGGYGFGRSSNTFPSFGGPRSRIEMRIYDLPWCGQQSRVEWGGEFSYDRVRHEQFFAYVRVRIPFGPRQDRPVLDPLRRRMVDTPVHRVD